MLSNLLISDSFAQAAENISPTNHTAGLANFIPLVLIFLVFYFLLIRPQQKKMKEHQNTLNDLKNGDKIYTNSGILGTVKSIDTKENIVELEIANGIIIKLLKQSISSVVKDKTLTHKPLKPHKNKK